jgi:hypothetical protein
MTHKVWHQAVGVDSDVELGALVFQTVEVSFVVVAATKRFSLLIAAHDDMVKETWRNDSGAAGHGRVSKIHPHIKILVIVMPDGRPQLHTPRKRRIHSVVTGVTD